MTTGERMKQRRKEIGFSAEKVAERLGVSPATIYRYEKGDIEKVPVDSLAELARILQTTPAYLMGWEECANSATPQPAPKTVYNGNISDSKITTSHAHSPCPSHRINDTDDRGHMCSSEREITGANDVSDTEDTVSHSCQHVSDNDDIDDIDEKYKNFESAYAPTHDIPPWLSEYTVIQSAQLPKNIFDYDPKYLSDYLIINDKSKNASSKNIDEHFTTTSSELPENSHSNSNLQCSNFPSNIQCDFSILCEDDSMSGIGIYKSDIAYIKKIDFIPRNGVIVAISADKKILLRRIYSDSNYIEFRPENPEFKAIIVDKSHDTPPEILGTLVGFTHCVNQSTNDDASPDC